VTRFRIVTNGASGFLVQQERRLLWYRWWTSVDYFIYSTLESAQQRLAIERQRHSSFDQVIQSDAALTPLRSDSRHTYGPGEDDHA
jgi:hypothetical protein